ncbi:MAG: prolyl oligopeptidase family serine peptidase, partial [Nannocystaceae bacterium]
SPENPEEFKALHAYSPLHNTKPGTQYPATLVYTADHDDRVVPGHSYKFTSAIQNDHRGDNPVMIRIDVRAGHGAGKPTTKKIEEWADLWGFLVKNLDMKIG